MNSQDTDCPPLIEAAKISLYRKNTFRITGLAIDATEKEIKRHVDELRTRWELGYGQGVNSSAFAIDPPPSEDEIREAMQKLKEPEHRLVDEFFWFWPQEFGKSANDPAIKAILSNDSETAYHIWTSLETNPDYDYIACHNIAVMFHLIALDWTLYHIESEVDKEREEKIKSYWKESFSRWEKIVTDDRVWATLKDRIRTINDPRLTTGFAIRMCNSLPEALDKINAEVALRFAEQGQTEWAKIHIEFMNETNQGLDDVEKTAGIVLTPTRNRVIQYLKIAQNKCGKAPENGINAIKELIEQCGPLQNLFELFYEAGSHQKAELFDEVATTITDCLIIYQKKTGDNETFVDLSKMALHFATGISVRERILKNIHIGEGNIKTQELSPIYKKLKEIQESEQNAEERFAKIKIEIIPKLSTLMNNSEEFNSHFSELFDSLAVVLRGISIDAHNKEKDLATSEAALKLALKTANSTELKDRLANDLKQIQKSISEHKKNDVLLKIRDDEIEINAKAFRYNQTIINTSEITGIRFGIFAQYTNGFQTSISYLIGILGNEKEISIECKRIFRSQKQAEDDYKKIINSITLYVIPSVAIKTAKRIDSGENVNMGDMRLTSNGIYMFSGSLWWKKEHLVPWKDVRFGTNAGILSVCSDHDKKISASASVRDDWNAVIFKQIAQSLMDIQAKT